jgi:hypothetical protein
MQHVVPQLSREEKDTLEDFAFEAARLLIDSRAGVSMREQVLRIWSAVRKAMDSSGGRLGPVSGFVIPTLRSIGLYSERIADHFAEMFEANFHSPEAGNLARLETEVPEDLEAWVDEGA